MKRESSSLIRRRVDQIRHCASRAISSPIVPGLLLFVGDVTGLAGDLAPDQELWLRLALAFVQRAAEAARCQLTGTAPSQTKKPAACQPDESDSDE